MQRAYPGVLWSKLHRLQLSSKMIPLIDRLEARRIADDCLERGAKRKHEVVLQSPEGQLET